MREFNKKTKISLVVPFYNEASNINEFYSRAISVLEKTKYGFEIICVNDGSSDETLLLLYHLHNEDNRIKVINLSRNFGKEIAMSAGLDYATGEAVIVIDADLQDPPELIPELIRNWEEGYDVVYATRTERIGESALKKITAHLFYRFMRNLSRINIPADTGDFRLMSKQVVDALKTIREHHRFMKGLFSWVGFRQVSVPYLREPRFAGQTKFNYWKLWNFAIEGITSFSFLPLQIATYLGFFVAFSSLLFALYLIIDTLIIGNDVPGYPSLMVTILFLGGIQLITLGIIGEYIGRIYNETKKRPLYIVQEAFGIDSNEQEIKVWSVENGKSAL